MDLGLAESVVVVVGAAGGIGRATAGFLREEGARVVWVDCDRRVEAVADEVDPTAARDKRLHILDATDAVATQRVADQLFAEFDACDHVVNCAGVGSGKLGFPFWNLSPADWPSVIAGNLLSTVNILHAFGPGMVPAKKGSFVVLSSVAGQIGSQTDPPYSAAKAAVINFAQCAAKDLAEHGIRVNVVAPGMVRTEINRQVWQSWRDASDSHTLDYDAWAADKIARVSPLGRWQSADEVAAAVGFLVSKFAASITGQTINVDGGQVMHS